MTENHQETYTFSAPISNLPLADIPMEGLTAFLSQGEDHQILFMQFEKDVDLPEHSHKAQVGFVLAGKIDLYLNGELHTYQTGQTYYIPEGMPHSGKIYGGYADITFFAEPDRYQKK